MKGKTSVSSSFSSAKRELHPEAEEKRTFPGPLSYDTDVDRKRAENESQRRSTSRSRRGSPVNAPRRTDEAFITNKDAQHFPGPGSYDVANESERERKGSYPHVGPTMSRAAQPSSTPLTPSSQPGPHSYTVRDPTSIHHTHVGVDLPLAPRRTDPSAKDAAQRPGPTSYERSESAALNLRPRSASPVIGKQSRDQIDKDKVANPGPGAYNNHEYDPAIHGDGRGAVTFSQVRRPLAGGLVVIDHTKQPGPSSYDAPHLEVIRDAPKNVVIGDSDRFPKNTNKNPAPGDYDIVTAGDKEREHHAVSIPNAQRLSTFDPKTMGTSAQTPGPLAYENAAARLNVGPRATIGKANINEPDPEKLAEKSNPGPQHYDTTRHHNFGSSHAGVSIPHANPRTDGQEKEKEKDLVGPGSYDLEAAIRARYHIRGGAPSNAIRRTIEPIGQTPDTVGPSSYEPKPLPPGLSAVIGSSSTKRGDGEENMDPEEREAHERPGPGSYDLPEQRSDRAFTIGNAPAHDRAIADNGVPGPASYDIENDPTRKDQRTVSIGNAVRETVGPEGTQVDNPGVGSYDPADPEKTSRMHTAPSYSITFANTNSSSATGEKGREGPGPASYDPRYETQERQLPNIAIGNAERFTDDDGGNRDLPGPGTYDVVGGEHEFGKDAPAASFGHGERRGLADDAERNDYPAPNSYDLPNPPQAQAPSFGSAIRPDIVSSATVDNPGVGAYVIPSTLDTPDHAPTIGTGARFAPSNPHDEEQPGPNHYFLPSTLNSQRAPSFEGPARDVGGAMETIARSIGMYPGPGHYDPYTDRGNGRQDLGDAINVFFGTAVRDLINRDKEDAPGPGYYQLPGFTSKSVVFPRAGAESDRELAEAADKPGPGWYILPETNDGRAPHFGTQIYDRNPNTTGGDKDAPGPGYYAVPDLPPLHPGVSLKGRNEPTDSREDNPGPGYYHVAYEIDPSKGPSIGTGSRDDVVATNEASQKPGPGQYDINEQEHWNHGVKIGTGGARPREDNYDNPGPGMYDLNDLLRNGETITISRGSLIGKAPRFDDGGVDKNIEVGPGQYARTDDNQPWVKNVLIGTAPRFEKSASEDVPAPGTYDLTNTLDPGRAVSFGNADPQASEDAKQRTAANDTPGPAQYQLPSAELTGIRAPAWTIVSKPPSMNDNRDVPGPGFYYVPNEIEGRGPTIGTAHRDDVVATNEASQKPGPGQYDSRTSWDAINNTRQAISLTFKQAVPGASDKDNEPGPNHYSTDGADVLRFPATPIWSIGKAPAHTNLIPDNGAPGPNYYALPDLRDKHGVPIPTAPRFPNDHNEDVPGPASYVFHEPIPGPHISFGTDGANRNATDIDIAPHSPGAKYNPMYTQVDRHQPAYSIPQSTEHMKTKPPSTQATYNVEVERPGPYYSFPRAIAHPEPHSESPGLIYTIPDPKPPPQWTFGRDMRFHDSIDGGTPGPGEYKIPTSLRTGGADDGHSPGNRSSHQVDLSKSPKIVDRRGYEPPVKSAAASSSKSKISIAMRDPNSFGGKNKSGFVRAKVASESLPGSPSRGVAGDSVVQGVSPQQQQQQSPQQQQQQ